MGVGGAGAARGGERPQRFATRPAIGSPPARLLACALCRPVAAPPAPPHRTPTHSAHSLHARAGEGVQHRADGLLIALEGDSAVLHIVLAGGGRGEDGRARGAPSHTPLPLAHPPLDPASLTGLRVYRMSEVPRMDHREMWCRGYLRSARPPPGSSTLNPSSPTSTWGRGEGEGTRGSGCATTNGEKVLEWMRGERENPKNKSYICYAY